MTVRENVQHNKKLEIIKRLKKGKTATSIAQIYGDWKVTVSNIRRVAEKD